MLSAQSSLAASLSLEAPNEIKVGDSLNVAIIADTDEVLINSLELVIDYDEEIFSFAGHSDENSMVTVWIEPPREKNGKIYLSGIIPGGVAGVYDPKKEELEALPLTHLIFLAKKETSAGNSTKFSFVSSEILIHDGVGTPLVYDEKGAEVNVQNNPDKKTNGVEEANTQAEKLPGETGFNFSFWLLILIISGFIVHKLLKYKA